MLFLSLSTMDDHCFFHLVTSKSQSQSLSLHSSSNASVLEPRTATEGRKTRDNIMLERKRRQDLAEKFIALSVIIPGLKKIDKASVLGEAVNYVKQLEGRVAVLEQEESKYKSAMSMMFSKKCQSQPPSAMASCGSDHVLPQVEVIIGLELERKVFIRILCEKRKGIVLKLLTLLQNVHLFILSSSVLPLGKNTLNITIIAQMGEEYAVTGDELVKKLTEDLLELYDLPP